MKDATVVIRPKETEKGITGRINHEKAVKMLTMINEQEGTHYAIPEGKGELGAGGFATVFDVEDREQYDFGLVAKFYPVSEQYEKYLDREMEFLINHNLGGELLPRTLHIYEIHHGHKDQDRTRIVIMEKYEEVADYFEMPLSEESLLQIASDILESLHYLHGHNETQKYYFHRDIKPDNIMVNDHLDSPRCILIDFNTVRESDDTHVNNPTMIGSRPFMPPELTDGERHTFRRHMELYSLGSVLYYYITGKTPTGMIQNGNTREDIVNELRHAASERKISDDFQKIILKAVENDPEFRYQAAEEMQEEINKLVLRSEEDSEDKLFLDSYIWVRDCDGNEIIPTKEQRNRYVFALRSIANVKDFSSFLHLFLMLSPQSDELVASTLSSIRNKLFDDKWPKWTPAAVQYYSCAPEENDMIMPIPAGLSKDDHSIFSKIMDAFTNDIRSDLWYFINVFVLLMEMIEQDVTKISVEDDNMENNMKKKRQMWSKDAFLSILNKIIYVNIDKGDDDDIKRDSQWSYSDLSLTTQERVMQALFMYVNADSKEMLLATIVGEFAYEYGEVLGIRIDNDKERMMVRQFNLNQEENKYDRPKDWPLFYLDDIFYEGDPDERYEIYEEYKSNLSRKDQEIYSEMRKRIQFYNEECFFLGATWLILIEEDPKRFISY